MNTEEQIDAYLDKAKLWVDYGEFTTKIMSITHILGWLFTMVILIYFGPAFTMGMWMFCILMASLLGFDILFKYALKKANKYLDASNELIQAIE